MCSLGAREKGVWRPAGRKLYVEASLKQNYRRPELVRPGNAQFFAACGRSAGAMLGSLTSGGFALVLRLTLNRLLGRFLGRRLERVEVRGDAIELRDVALDAAALEKAQAQAAATTDRALRERDVASDRASDADAAAALVTAKRVAAHAKVDLRENSHRVCHG